MTVSDEAFSGPSAGVTSGFSPVHSSGPSAWSGSNAQGITDMEKNFETTGPINLKVELLAGDVRITAVDAASTSVRLIPNGRRGEELMTGFTIEARGNDVVVLAPKGREGFFGMGAHGSVDVEITLHTDSAVDARTGSGDVTAVGILGDVSSATGSGDITVQELDSGDLKSGSGDLTVRSVRTGLSAKTGSGDIVVDSAHGALDLVSGSGDIVVRRAQSRVKAKTGSGDVTIAASAGDLDVLTGTGDVDLGAVHGGEVRAKTGTGDIEIGVAVGVVALLDLNTVTGDVDVDLDETDGPAHAEAQTRLAAHSGSGDVHVKRAQVKMS